MMRYWFLGGLLLTGCPPQVPEIDTGLESTPLSDADGDGFLIPDDCDDHNASVNPEAVDICNGVDDNCDGQLDESPDQTQYVDADGDGAGSSTTLQACAGTAGTSATSDDCDDNNPDVSPNVAEVCDTLDNNCNGQADEGVQVAVYPDTDGDGDGDAETPATSGCLAAGFSEINGDCDDLDPSINSEVPEVCDGIDNNCNDQIDDGVTVPLYTDTDGDGYGAGTMFIGCPNQANTSSNDDDCNDTDFFISPDIIEVCDTIDNNCNGRVDDGVLLNFYEDNDQDGYGDSSTVVQGCSAPIGMVSTGGDCDDTAMTVHPNATEVCDDVDTDCDGVGDSPPTWFRDADGDGYGALLNTVQICVMPSGYVSDSSDCNDGDRGVHPLATETCDNRDEDCDGVVDNGAGTIWYVDADNDRYGDASQSQTFCNQPSGYSQIADDCDDHNASISPSGTETCNNADDNCDGQIDESLTITWYADLDGDRYGDAFNTQQACTQPVSYTSNTEDCDDSDATINPSAAEVCLDGIDQNCNGAADGCRLGSDFDLSSTSIALLGENTNDQAGSSLAIVPDTDGDGTDELLIGAPTTTSTGYVYLVRGTPVSGSLATSSAILLGTVNETGYWVGSGWGDDGLPRLLVSSNSGETYIIPSDITGTQYMSLAAETRYYSSSSSVSPNFPMAMADYDGDSYTDTIIGANSDDASGRDSGEILLLNGPISGQVNVSTYASRITGENAYDRAGYVVNAGDSDGDGLEDLLVGAWAADAGSGTPGTGAAYLLTQVNSLNGGSLVYADNKFSGQNQGDYAGYTLCAGDIDNDGLPDMVISAPYYNNRDGIIYIDYSSTGWVSNLGNADRILSPPTGAIWQLGTRLSCGSDYDGDGHTDLLIGAPSADYSDTNDGAAALIYGSQSTGSEILSSSTVGTLLYGGRRGVQAGYGLDMGDVDGDGWPDLAIGVLNGNASTGLVAVVPNSVGY